MQFFFFFKQKTAYEMRISDWSSDVCSSDLLARDLDDVARPGRRHIVGDGRADLGQFDPETGEAGFDIGHDHSLAVREGSCSAGAGSPVAASRAMRRPSQRSMTAAATELPTTFVAERPMSSSWSTARLRSSPARSEEHTS